MATINVRTSSGTVAQVTGVDEAGSVAAFKALVAEKTGIPIEQLRVVSSGHVLKDDKTLADYNLKDGATVNVVRTQTAPPAAATAPSSSVPRNASSASTAPAAGGNLFSPAPAAAPARGGRRLGGPMPEQMRQGLRALAQNPQAFMQMLQSDPRFANNPMMRQAINDPNFLAMLQNPDTLNQIVGGAIVSREIFDVAIRCMNGEAIPDDYPTLQAVPGQRGAARIIPPVSQGGQAAAPQAGAPQASAPQASAPQAGRREFVSRASITQALAAIRPPPAGAAPSAAASAPSTPRNPPSSAPALHPSHRPPHLLLSLPPLLPLLRSALAPSLPSSAPWALQTSSSAYRPLRLPTGM